MIENWWKIKDNRSTDKQFFISILSGSLIISCLKKKKFECAFLQREELFGRWLADSWNIYFDSCFYNLSDSQR